MWTWSSLLGSLSRPSRSLERRRPVFKSTGCDVESTKSVALYSVAKKNQVPARVNSGAVTLQNKIIYSREASQIMNPKP